MDSKIYTSKEEWANTITHGFGIIVGILASIFLLHKSELNTNAYATISVIIYLIGMLCSYITSTCYHATKNAANKKLLRKFDHAAIYLHIAGTYTPFTLLILWTVGWWGIGILSFIWFSAFLGVFLSFKKSISHSYLETICYVLMGSVVLIALKPLWNTLSIQNHLSAFYWLIGGGISYIIGALFYSLHKKKYMHSIFHLFVLGGSFCHIFAIWIIL